jgi:hypothetical protein
LLAAAISGIRRCIAHANLQHHAGWLYGWQQVGPKALHGSFVLVSKPRTERTHAGALDAAAAAFGRGVDTRYLSASDNP